MFSGLITVLFYASSSVGGAVLGVTAGTIALQASGSGISLDPALAAAYGAIGALFSVLVAMAKGRIDRCEKREDTLLETDTERTVTMRELSTSNVKMADVTLGAVTAAKEALDESKRNGGKLDALTIAVAELARGMERFAPEPDAPPPRRRQ